MKAVLFDLDGVLADCRHAHYAALNIALQAHGYEIISLDEHKFEFDGLPTRTKLVRLSAQGRVRTEDWDSIRAMKQRETVRLVQETVKFDPTIFCVVAGLKARGIRWGIVTNAVGDTVFEITRRLDLPFPDTLVTNEETSPKPSPAPYELACSRLRIETREALAVEDGHYGIESATKAGCRVMSVSSPADVTPKAIWEMMECTAKS